MNPSVPDLNLTVNSVQWIALRKAVSITMKSSGFRFLELVSVSRSSAASESIVVSLLGSVPLY